MRKTRKKGFTIVELVIVIAVIAILAAVLIPTFSGVVTRAKKSAAESDARNAMTQDLVNAEGDYANMLIYVSTDGKQLYEVTLPAGTSLAGYYKATTSGGTTTYTACESGTAGTGDANTEYYAAYQGKYDADAKTYTYDSYVYNIAEGKWAEIES